MSYVCAFFAVVLCFFPKLAIAQVNNEDNQIQITSEAESSLLQQSFDDWTYRCLSPEVSESRSKADLNCEISQSVQIEQDGNPIEVLNMSLSRANDKAGKINWALVVLSPLDVHLPSQFGLVMGKRKPVLTQYRNCNHLGCWVVIPADKSIINGLKKSKDGAGVFRLLNGKVVRIVFSLSGFTKAFMALSDNAAPQVQAEASSIATQ